MKTYFSPLDGEFVVGNARVKATELLLHRTPGVPHRNKGVTTCRVGRERMVAEYRIENGTHVFMTLKPLAEVCPDDTLLDVMEEVARMHQLRKFVGSNGGCVVNSFGCCIGVEKKKLRKLITNKELIAEAEKLMELRNNFVILAKKTLAFIETIKGASNV